MAEKSREKIHLGFFAPLAAIAALALLTLVMSLFVWAASMDGATRRREEALVTAGIAARIQELEAAVMPEVMWDDAVANLDNRFDAEWAHENVGAYLHQTSGIDMAFVIDGEGRVLYASKNGELAPLTAYRDFAVTAAPLIAEVRRQEIARGPLRHQANGAMMARAIDHSVVQQIRGFPYVVSATLVQPDWGKAMPKGVRAPVAVTAEALDKDFLQVFERRFLLQDPHLTAGGVKRRPGKAQVALPGPGGGAISTLVWTPQRPGARFLERTLPPIALFVALLIALSALLYLHARRAARKLVASEAKATHMAMHDALTGLPNRVLFSDRLAHATVQLRREGGAVALLCLDLDRFKDVNDTYGHHCGDELIEETARRLRAVCRAEDTVARLSGDEFAIVQHPATPSGAAALARRILKALSGPVDLSGGRVFLSCSIGVTLVRDADVDGAEALRQADLALYRAKDNGRGQHCFFEQEMDAALKQRKAIEADLRQALKAEALQLAYQPVVDAKGRIVCLEALARWTDPERGQIPPSVFVPIAEECGLIEALGLLTLKRAFSDSRRWPELKVAVNISASQLRSARFADVVAKLVAETGVDPRRFEIEITEGVLLNDDLATQESLGRLRQMGFGLALDDFGTGYSSLSYLRRYPVDKIKIDRSFVVSLGDDADAGAVVRAIVQLAQALQLEVVAEGVETAEQRERLMKAGCSLLQGYLYSRPLPPEAIEALMADGAILTPAD
jgi:diguanylate cyclase (GGDEF)-like protein